MPAPRCAARRLLRRQPRAGRASPFFALLFGARQEVADAARLRRWATGAALLGVLAGIGALAAQVGVLTGGETLLDADVWGVVVASRAGTSYALGGAGLLLVALLAFGQRWALPAALGGLLVCASYAAVGHTTMLTPRPALAALLTVHLTVAAFWIGGLAPLACASRREGPAAARLVEGWARVAALAGARAGRGRPGSRLANPGRRAAALRVLVRMGAAGEGGIRRRPARLRRLAPLSFDAGVGRRRSRGWAPACPLRRSRGGRGPAGALCGR
jgi:hypothetical protein